MERHGTRTGSIATAEMDGADREVQAFLDRFADALTAGDGRTAATLWGYPALVMGDGGAQAVATPEEVEKFYGSAKEQYNARGIVSTRAEVFGLEWATERIVIVDVRWPNLDAKGTEIGAESSTYTIRRDDQGNFRLHIALMRGEEKRA